MATIEIKVDAKAVDDLAASIAKAKRQVLGRLAERGYQLLREEVPVDTGNLKQGVAAPDVNYDAGTATLTVSARSARLGPRQAVVIGADGEEKKRVTLKSSPGFNYAAAVAQGRPAIEPKNGQALLIPVPSAPSGQGYLIAGGQIFVVRKSAKAVAPNPYDERAAKRLEGEAEKIADAVLKKIFV